MYSCSSSVPLSLLDVGGRWCSSPVLLWMAGILSFDCVHGYDISKLCLWVCSPTEPVPAFSDARRVHTRLSAEHYRGLLIHYMVLVWLMRFCCGARWWSGCLLCRLGGWGSELPGLFLCLTLLGWVFLVGWWWVGGELASLTEYGLRRYSGGSGGGGTTYSS